MRPCEHDNSPCSAGITQISFEGPRAWRPHLSHGITRHPCDVFNQTGYSAKRKTSPAVLPCQRVLKKSISFFVVYHSARRRIDHLCVDHRMSLSPCRVSMLHRFWLNGMSQRPACIGAGAAARCPVAARLRKACPPKRLTPSGARPFGISAQAWSG